MGLQLGKPDFMAKSDDGQTISDMYMYITNRLIGLLYVDSIEELYNSLPNTLRLSLGHHGSED